MLEPNTNQLPSGVKMPLDTTRRFESSQLERQNQERQGDILAVRHRALSEERIITRSIEDISMAEEMFGDRTSWQIREYHVRGG